MSEGHGYPLVPYDLANVVVLLSAIWLSMLEQAMVMHLK
jgi:hypothetical protein